MTDDLHAETGKGDPFAAAMRATRMPMIITDPRQTDNPIVFANDAFLRLTGYERHEVVGQNCRFLQGPGSDQEAIARIREAIRDRRDIKIDILNYKKDGSTFWNALYLSPVSNEDGELKFFFASQLDITERKRMQGAIEAERVHFEEAVRERTRELEAALEAKTLLLHEVDHRVKNNLQMISSLIVMQSRDIPDENIRTTLRAMLERVEALSTVHRRLYQSEDVGSFDVGAFAGDLVQDLVSASGRSDIRVDLDLDRVEVPAQKAAPVALMMNELVTNAIKHGFRDGRAGRIGVSVKQNSGDYHITIEDDGPGMNGQTPPPSRPGGSFGQRLVKSLARQLQADIVWNEGTGSGTRVLITLPNG